MEINPTSKIAYLRKSVHSKTLGVMSCRNSNPFFLESTESDRFQSENRNSDTFIPQTRKNQSKQTVLDMMGYPKSSDKGLAFMPLQSESSKKMPLFALADLMGNKKYKFFKGAGLGPVYHLCRKSEELQSIIEKNHEFTIGGIKHLDKIRENSIKRGNNRKVTEKIEFFPTSKKSKFLRRDTKKRLDQIQVIIDKCDSINSNKPKLRVCKSEVKDISLASIYPDAFKEKIVKKMPNERQSMDYYSSSDLLFK